MGVLRDPFFLYSQLSAWPDQLDRNGLINSIELQADQKAAGLFRLGDVDFAESLLLAHLGDIAHSTQVRPLALLGWIRLDSRDFTGFQYVFRTLQRNWPDQPEVRALLFKYLLVQGRGRSIASDSSQWLSLSDPQQRQLHQLLHAEWLLVTGRASEVRSWLDQSLIDQSLEASMLSARCEKAEGNLLAALDHLTALLERAPVHFQLWLYALETALDAKHSEAVLALARRAFERFGENHRLLQHLTPMKMLQRQPGLARRSALLQQLWATTLKLPSSRPGNQLNTYEHNGDTYWLEYLKPSVLANPLSAQQEYSNYMLQLASIESGEYGKANQRYISALRSSEDFRRCCDVGGRTQLRSLRQVCVSAGSQETFRPTQLVAFFLVFLTHSIRKILYINIT